MRVKRMNFPCYERRFANDLKASPVDQVLDRLIDIARKANISGQGEAESREDRLMGNHLVKGRMKLCDGYAFPFSCCQNEDSRNDFLEVRRDKFGRIQFSRSWSQDHGLLSLRVPFFWHSRHSQYAIRESS